jgi:hypothetical protein
MQTYFVKLVCQKASVGGCRVPLLSCRPHPPFKTLRINAELCFNRTTVGQQAADKPAPFSYHGLHPLLLLLAAILS